VRVVYCVRICAAYSVHRLVSMRAGKAASVGMRSRMHSSIRRMRVFYREASLLKKKDRNWHVSMHA
jgi:hypothetical protein